MDPRHGQEVGFELKHILLGFIIFAVIFMGNNWINNCYNRSAIYPMYFTYEMPDKKVVSLDHYGGHFSQVVLAIDNHKVAGKSPEEIIKLLRGLPWNKIQILYASGKIGWYERNSASANNDTFGCPKPMNYLLETRVGEFGFSSEPYRLHNKSGMVAYAIRKDSPAEKAGIMEMDLITAIDGVALDSQILSDNAKLQDLFLGYPGSVARLKVLRQQSNGGWTELTINVTRAIIDY